MMLQFRFLVVICILSICGNIVAQEASVASNPDVQSNSSETPPASVDTSTQTTAPQTTVQPAPMKTVAAEPIAAAPIAAKPIAAEPIAAEPTIPPPPPLPIQNAKEWKISIGGTATGPFSTAQVTQMIESGQLSIEAHAWKEGMDEWKLLKEIPVFSNVAPQNAGSQVGSDNSNQPTRPAGPVSNGGAIASGVIGTVSGLTSMGLGIAAAANTHDDSVAIPLGSASLGTMALMAPIVFGINHAARRKAVVRGLLGLRISGWVGYVSTLGLGIAEIVVGATGGIVPSEAVMSATMLGTATMAFFSADAFATASQISRVNASQASRKQNNVSLAPLLSPVGDHRGTTGGVAGLFGTF